MTVGAARALAALAALALAPRAARAQTAPPQGVRSTSATPDAEPMTDERASRLFTDAVEHLQSERFADALELLEVLRASRELPAVYYNLAIAQRGLGRNLDAIASLERYLALAGPRLDADRRRQVEARLAELRSALATVIVRVVPSSATVTVRVDGVALPRARWAQPLPIDPGRHAFAIAGEGYLADVRVRAVARGQALTVELFPERRNVVTRLRLVAPVPRAELFVNRVLAGTGACDVPVRPGRVDVEVRARGYVPYATTVLVPSGQTVQLRARLTREVRFYESPAFWGVIGVLIGGGIVAGALVGLSGTDPPSTSNVFTTP